MDRWKMDGLMEDGWMNGQTNGWMDGSMEDGWIDEWMDGLIDGRWMDEWIDEWMDGLMTADLPQIIYISLASNGIGQQRC